MEDSRNLALWNSVAKTDPQYVKPFRRGGGFSGSAINGTYQVRRATEMFGPIGSGWGYTIKDERYVEGAPIARDGVVVGHEIVHVATIQLWYTLDGEKYYIEHKGQTMFVGQNKNGIYTDEEAPKKSLTDGLCKCLTMLGFSADVYLGAFDDNKYVNDPSQREHSVSSAASEPSPYDKAVSAMSGAVDKRALDNVLARCKMSQFTQQQMNKLEKQYNDRLQSLTT